MITGGHEMKEFRPAKKRVEVSVGESVRILRELDVPKAVARRVVRRGYLIRDARRRLDLAAQSIKS